MLSSSFVMQTRSLLCTHCRYIHNADWDAAMRVAEAYDPPSMSDIMLAQATAAAEAGQNQV